VRTDVVDVAVAGLPRWAGWTRRNTLGTASAAKSRPAAVEEDHDVYVIQPSDLPRMRGWHVPARVVVDATREEHLTRQTLAQIVVLRRRLKAAGGELILAASTRTAQRLCGYGVHWAVPCHEDLSIAMETARRDHGGGRGLQTHDASARSAAVLLPGVQLSDKMVHSDRDR